MPQSTLSLRRGLPRRPGGEPWPEVEGPITVDTDWTPAAAAVSEPADSPAMPRATEGGPDDVTAAASAPAPERVVTSAAPAQPTAAEPAGAGLSLRRGLPRTPGGEPWPPETGGVTAAPALDQAAPEQPIQRAAMDQSDVTASTGASEAPAGPTAPATAHATGSGTTLESRRLRRGLPRTAGGDPWPPDTEVQVPVHVPAEVATETITADQAPGAVAQDAARVPAPAASVPTGRATRVGQGSASSSATGSSAATAPSATPAAQERRPRRERTPLRESVVGRIVLGAAGLVLLAGLAVLTSRWFLASEAGQSFVETYPGEYHLPEGAPVGFPAWLGWQHFLNMFLMVLVIRSGIQIRREKRPSAYWTPRGRTEGKVSLTTWFHQSLDVLWLVNGALFIVLLFVSGQWMRVVPTSWEVFPNALSAGLQYMSLDWPTDNGWVNYNSLQQLAYFVTIFIAAPLAAATGFRMSGLWPKRATGLSRAYPIEVARAIHFPVMIYFVAFIAVHVILVFATGALRNLNHMYAAQGSTDATAFADNWLGFWMFVLSLAVVAGAVALARPFVLAQVAKLFGTVSSR